MWYWKVKFLRNAISSTYHAIKVIMTNKFIEFSNRMYQVHNKSYLIEHVGLRPQFRFFTGCVQLHLSLITFVSIQWFSDRKPFTAISMIVHNIHLLIISIFSIKEEKSPSTNPPTDINNFKVVKLIELHSFSPHL